MKSALKSNTLNEPTSLLTICNDAFCAVALFIHNIDATMMQFVCKKLQDITRTLISHKIIKKQHIHDADNVSEDVAKYAADINCKGSAKLLIRFGLFNLYDSLEYTDDGAKLRTYDHKFVTNEMREHKAIIRRARIITAIKSKELITAIILTKKYVEIDGEYFDLALTHSLQIFDYLLSKDRFSFDLYYRQADIIINANNFAAIDILVRRHVPIDKIVECAFEYNNSIVIDYLLNSHHKNIENYLANNDDLVAYRYLYYKTDIIPAWKFLVWIMSNESPSCLKYVLEYEDSEDVVDLLKIIIPIIIKRPNSDDTYRMIWGNNLIFSNKSIVMMNVIIDFCKKWRLDNVSMQSRINKICAPIVSSEAGKLVMAELLTIIGK